MATERTKHERVTEATASAERLMRPQHVPVNVYETGDALVVVAPLPAVRPSDVTIDLTPGHLRITAHLRSVDRGDLSPSAPSQESVVVSASPGRRSQGRTTKAQPWLRRGGGRRERRSGPAKRRHDS